VEADSGIIEVAAGLWIWRMPHPEWEPPGGGDRVVTSTCVASGDEVVVLDPLAPSPDALELWDRLDAQPPTMAVVLKPDHVRSVDLFVRRYGCRAYGPRLFFKDDLPATDLQPVDPGDSVPGGLVALYDGRNRMETPIWLPEQRTIVFADALTTLGGELQVWGTPPPVDPLPALRALLELPFERVIVSHGQPVHDRAEYERALERPPFGGRF
jgi:glyoxylase-like metal-dependent hydrolase (beta-lactamase superfamily II)